MLARHPERVIEHAVRGMLPKNALGRAMFRKLKVYAADSHPHEAQVKAETTPALPRPSLPAGRHGIQVEDSLRREP